MLIAVTGYDGDTDRKQTMAAGFDHHVVKPVHADELTALLCGFATSAQVKPISVHRTHR
jgi:CheY-like chemotaxis protein